jgi:hypothetical protein
MIVLEFKERNYGYVAQLVERPDFTGQVAGSSPAISTSLSSSNGRACNGPLCVRCKKGLQVRLW